MSDSEFSIPIIAAPGPADLLLGFTSTDPDADDGDGRPWGDGTAMSARARQPGGVPWDTGCSVVPMIGGAEAMRAMRESFEAAIVDAEAQAGRGVPPGRRGQVCIVDWQLNALRDLSEGNPWDGRPWDPVTVVARDQTAIGLIVRMMSAGIVVRVLVWMPTTAQAMVLGALANAHWSLAAAVQDHDAALRRLWGLDQPLGVVALDLRTAAPLTASLHQKMSTIRVGAVQVAYCGGVDLAFTRRDPGTATDADVTGFGDWQSGDTIPLAAAGWPKQSPPPAGGYPRYPYLEKSRFPEDLPANVYGEGYRRWFDQHLRLEGPVVATLEEQFAERWVMSTQGRVYVFDRRSVIGLDNQVQLTAKEAIDGKRIVPVPVAPAPARAGDAVVQMWRTIPLRPHCTTGPFVRGEFTVMAGIAKAISGATQLITIWDQYFWNKPLARLLAATLNERPGLHVQIVLPPFGTTDTPNELRLRREALQELWHGIETDEGRSRMHAYDLWAAGPDVGIYVHAKVQTYDDRLLVCGSANLNRRSFECDAELDCAVLDQPTVTGHLARLHHQMTGIAWTDTGPGWLVRYWASMAEHRGGTLVDDPFYAAAIGSPTTPNGVPMPSDGMKPFGVFDPTSIGSDLQRSVCGVRSCTDDPRVAGRLDELTYLLERCHDGTRWPWRTVNTSPLSLDSSYLGPGESARH